MIAIMTYSIFSTLIEDQSSNIIFSGLYDQSLYGGASHPHPHDFHSRMQTFGFGPGHPAGLDQAAAAAQYMAAGVGVGPAGYDAMYKGMFYAVLASS